MLAAADLFSRNARPILQPTGLATWTTDGHIDVLILIYEREWTATDGGWYTFSYSITPGCANHWTATDGGWYTFSHSITPGCANHWTATDGGWYTFSHSITPGCANHRTAKDDSTHSYIMNESTLTHQNFTINFYFALHYFFLVLQIKSV
jgi:hypothetical protein